MTFIAVRCLHCHSDQIVKRGKTARGTQRYLCQNSHCTKGSFLLDYCNRVVSLNCCDELHFWKQVFDGTQLVKELYGHPICQQLTRRPGMIGQTRCHRWGHGSPRTQ